MFFRLDLKFEKSRGWPLGNQNILPRNTWFYLLGVRLWWWSAFFSSSVDWLCLPFSPSDDAGCLIISLLTKSYRRRAHKPNEIKTFNGTQTQPEQKKVKGVTRTNQLIIFQGRNQIASKAGGYNMRINCCLSNFQSRIHTHFHSTFITNKIQNTWSVIK